jgi:hypothetical protein
LELQFLKFEQGVSMFGLAIAARPAGSAIANLE